MRSLGLGCTAWTAGGPGRRTARVKLAITGKGGVGKTTFSALLARALRAGGRDVIAIDADPDSNLAACMGHPEPESIRPLIELKDLIEERTGAKPGTVGGMFRLNPFVADIPETHSVDIDGVRVLVSGAVKRGGAGCYCPENALVRALISHLLLDPSTALVLDMEAGVEHIGRGTVGAVDCLLIVVTPSRRSVETAARIRRSAADIGITRIGAVGNKVRSERDRGFLMRLLPDVDFCGFLPLDESVIDAEREGLSVWDAGATVRGAVTEVVEFLERQLGTTP